MSDEENGGMHDHEISSGDADAVRRRVGVDLTRDGSGLLEFIAGPGEGAQKVHFHMFAESVDVRDSWLVACGSRSCTERNMIPLPLVETWKRQATPHQVWLLNWQIRCEVTLTALREKHEG